MITCGIASLTLLTYCQKDPQKKAENIAEHEATRAENHAESAESHVEEGMNQSAESLAHASMEEVNRAIAAIPVPEFSNSSSKELARKIGNHAIDFVNANNYEESGKYADKIRENLQELDKKESKGTIDATDAKKIREYAQSIAQAIGTSL